MTGSSLTASGTTRERFYEWMERSGQELSLPEVWVPVQAGEVREELVHDSIEAVRGRVVEEARRVGNPMQAVIEGVDDAWEISVLRFTFEMVQKSPRDQPV